MTLNINDFPIVEDELSIDQFPTAEWSPVRMPLFRSRSSIRMLSNALA